MSELPLDKMPPKNCPVHPAKDVEPASHAEEPGSRGPEWMRRQTCPACGFGVAADFYLGGEAPLTTLAWPRSEWEARAMERLPLNFVRCVDCGHIYNRDFHYDKVPYSEKPNLMYNRGALWQEHLALTLELILDRLPEQPVVVEIGAGDGHFIRALASHRPEGRYLAFDPNGCMDNPDGASEGNPALPPVEFHAALFDPARHMGELRPDLLICRHTLEHLENPLGFIQALSFGAAWEGLETSLFVEVPCVDRAIEAGRTVDFFYEHCSHFTRESLARMLTASHAHTELLSRGYEEEVVYAYARLGAQSDGLRKHARESGQFYEQAQTSDSDIRADLDSLAQTGRTIAVWGGTGKAATFINRYGVDAERFPMVVDSDPAKADTHVPGAGQKIQTPDVLLNTPAEVILIATQWRAWDIALEIRERGIACRQLLLEHQGRLVDFYRDTHPYRPSGIKLQRKAASSRRKRGIHSGSSLPS